MQDASYISYARWCYCVWQCVLFHILNEFRLINRTKTYIYIYIEQPNTFNVYDHNHLPQAICQNMLFCACASAYFCSIFPFQKSASFCWGSSESLPLSFKLFFFLLFQNIMHRGFFFAIWRVNLSVASVNLRWTFYM